MHISLQYLLILGLCMNNSGLSIEPWGIPWPCFVGAKQWRQRNNVFLLWITLASKSKNQKYQWRIVLATDIKSWNERSRHVFRSPKIIVLGNRLWWVSEWAYALTAPTKLKQQSTVGSGLVRVGRVLCTTTLLSYICRTNWLKRTLA